MHLAIYFGALVTAAVISQGYSIKTVIALYGETIEVPCDYGENKAENLVFTKWKYDNEDGTAGDLLVKQVHKDEATVSAIDGYKDRVSITANSSLLITQGTLADQRTFTCMQVSSANLYEYPVEVRVYKRPSAPEIQDKVKELENGKLTTLGICVTHDANPPANITWLKNGVPLGNDDMTVVITSTVTEDPDTGLSTTSSKLEYAAGKDDMSSVFTCSAHHSLGPEQVSAPESFIVHYPTEKVSLQVLSAGPVKEGDNVTLRCQADGNPPPTSFNFNIKGQIVTVTDSDTFALTGVTRADAGEYQCSLTDDAQMQASETLVVSYLDFSLSPTGKLVKKLGDSLLVQVDKNASNDVIVTWTKDNGKLEKMPSFEGLTYADAGLYVCEVSVTGLKLSKSFHLVVEGKPVIKKLSKKHSENGKNKILICEAEGSPRPDVQWSVNGTDGESEYSNGGSIHKLTVVPRKNLTVSCVVTNVLGKDEMTINVLSISVENEKEEEDPLAGDGDQTKVIVGVVVAIAVIALAGLAGWLYIRRTRQGSWKTGEKEDGTSEESKKLEENNHKPDV